LLNVTANQENETAVKFHIGGTERPEKGRGVSCHVTVMLLLSCTETHSFVCFHVGSQCRT